MRHTTTKDVISYINANYHEWTLSGWVTWKLAAECNTSRQTVYKAIRQLRAMGAMDGKTFIRRQWITFDDLLPFFRNDMLLVDIGKAGQIASKTVASIQAVYDALRWAQMCGQVEQLNGGAYGLLYRLKAGEHNV